MSSPNVSLGTQFQLPGVSPANVPQTKKSNLSPTQRDAGNAGANVAPPEANTNTVLQTLASIGQTLSLMLQQQPVGVSTPPPNALANAAIQQNRTTNPLQRDRMNDALAKLAQDPEGSRLLEAALAKGYTIEVGDPNATGVLDKGAARDAVSCAHCQAQLDGGGQVNGVTIPGQKKIVVNPNAPDFEKTLVHELVHASTEGDGNSQHEEGIADVVGYRVAERITGKVAPGTQQQIYSNKILNYPGLNRGNNVESSLGRLGLSAFA